MNAPGLGNARTFSRRLEPAVGPTASAPAVPESLGPLAAPPVPDAAAPPDAPPEEPPEDPPDPPPDPPDPPLPPPRANALSATTIVAAQANISATTNAIAFLMNNLLRPNYSLSTVEDSKPPHVAGPTPQR